MNLQAGLLYFCGEAVGKTNCRLFSREQKTSLHKVLSVFILYSNVPLTILVRRDQQNIEAAHIVALVRHSTWSAIVFDLFFGILAGAFFLCYQSDINHYIRSIARSLTDDILRTGCIWLMGVPAGFKLNTQLAETLGLVSLNMIQVWSTLLYFLKPVFGPCLFLFAISGMLLGITVPAAMIADMLFLATFHISTLHQLVAFLYSNQLQALAALWRLFRLTAYTFFC